MRGWIIAYATAMISLGCSGVDGSPFEDAGDSDAAADVKRGVALDSGTDAMPVGNANECAAQPQSDAGLNTSSCEPVDDSFCAVASACGDEKHTHHYACEPGSGPFVDLSPCLYFGNGDYCCARQDCTADVDHGACAPGTFLVACWPEGDPGTEGTSCVVQSPAFGTHHDDSFYCCANFEPPP